MANKKVLVLHDTDGYMLEANPTTEILDLGQLNVTGAVAMNTNAITGLPTPGSASAAATKQYVDEQVISGGHVKEPIFDSTQLSDAEGLLAGEVCYFTAQPTLGDHVTIGDGTNTEDYVFVANIGAEAGPLDVSRETTAATALARLVVRINAGSAYWKATYLASSHSDINSPVALIMDETTDAVPSTSRIYALTQGNANLMVVPFASGTTTITILPYTYKTAAASSATDPGYQRFGLARAVASLTDGEMHLDLSADNLYSWNGDASAWYMMSGPGSIPLATAANGGGTIGRAGFDKLKAMTDNGSGIVGIALTTNYALQFHPVADADQGKLEILLASADQLTQSVAGLAVAGLPSLFKIGGNFPTNASVSSANLNTLTAGSSSDASALHTHSGIDDAEDILHSFVIGNVAGVIVGDPVYMSAVAGKVNRADNASDGMQWVIGIASEIKAQNAACKIYGYGYAPTILTGLGFVAGDRLFLNTPSGMTKTAPTTKHIMQCGWATSAVDMWVQPQYMGKKV